MNDSTAPIRLGDTLGKDFLTLPRAAMQELGAAAQTFGAVYLLAIKHDGETFAPLRKIAELAELPRRTVQAHLHKLIHCDWVEYGGREMLPGSTYRRRRTVTLRLTAKAQNKREPFATLPRWAATRLNTWGERAVFAVLVSAQHFVDAVARDEAGCADGREFVNVRTVAKLTGLTTRAVRAARGKLAAAELICVIDGDPTLRQGAKLLALNPEYEIRAADRAKPVTQTRPPCQDGMALGHPDTPGKTCAYPRKILRIPPENPAHTPGKSCADPPENPAHTPGKTCAPQYKNLLLEFVCENPLQETNIRIGQENVRAVADSGSHANGFDHSDLFFLDAADDARVAADIFHRLAYTSPAEIVWQVACLYRHRQLSEHQYVSAANSVATAQTAIANPPGYFRATLAESIGGKANLDALLARVRNPAKLADPPALALGRIDADRRRQRQRVAHDAAGRDPTPIGDVIDKMGLSPQNPRSSNGQAEA